MRSYAILETENAELRRENGELRAVVKAARDAIEKCPGTCDFLGECEHCYMAVLEEKLKALQPNTITQPEILVFDNPDCGEVE